jgi:hypothetical protein
MGENRVETLHPSLVFYASSVAAFVTKEERHLVDWKAVEKNPFAVIMFLVALAFLVVLSCIAATSR